MCHCKGKGRNADCDVPTAAVESHNFDGMSSNDAAVRG